MTKTVADVMKLVKEKECTFVDFRFVDTKGKEQHVSVPISAFNEDKFESGHAFDGSSIAGWKGIEASDMLLMPDPTAAYVDPFYEEPTLVLTCDVIEPSDGKGYDRDPRSIAKRAEAYLKSSGLGDAAYFGPEPEFFVFDGVQWNVDMQGCSVKIHSEEAPWSSGLEIEGGNTGHRPGKKGGYFPVAPVDTFQDMRSEMCLILESLGIPVEVHHHEVLVKAKMSWVLSSAHSCNARIGPFGKSMWYRTWRTPMARPQPLCQNQLLVITAQACTCISQSGKTVRTSLQVMATRDYQNLPCITSAASSNMRAHSMQLPTQVQTRISV